MAKSPSNIALLVTNFLLNINTWRYTTGGKAIITTVQTAASGSTTVTDAEYDQYTQYTAWRWQTFVQHNALTS